MDIDKVKAQGNQASAILAENSDIDKVKAQGNQAGALLPEIMSASQKEVDWQAIAFPSASITLDNVVDIRALLDSDGTTPTNIMFVVDTPDILAYSISADTAIAGMPYFNCANTIQSIAINCIMAYFSNINPDDENILDKTFAFLAEFESPEYIEVYKTYLNSPANVLSDTAIYSVVEYGTNMSLEARNNSTYIDNISIISENLITNPAVAILHENYVSLIQDTNWDPAAGLLNLSDGYQLVCSLAGFVRQVDVNDFLIDIYNNTIAKMPVSKARKAAAKPVFYNFNQIRELFKNKSNN